MSLGKSNSHLGIFEDIKINQQYSKYLKDLNKIYSQSGLQTFLNSLKHRKVELKNDLQLFSQKAKEKSHEEFNSKSYETMLNKIKEKIINKRHYVKIPANPRTLINLAKRRKNIIEESKEASFNKYRPNFNSIRKKVRIIDFSKEMPRKTIFSYLVSPHNSSAIDSTSFLKPKEDSSSNSTIIDKENLPHLPSNSFSYENIFNRKDSNKAMRFSKYTWRKDFIPKYHPSESMREHSSFISNMNTNRCFEFNKMKTNSHLPLTKTINGPTIGMYNPNYSSIFENSPKVTFCFSDKKKWNKQFLIKKIWKNYEVRKGYQLVDFE